MTLEELMAAVGKLTTAVTDIGAQVQTIAASQAAATQSAGAARDKVKPHVEGLRTMAAAMETAGIGVSAGNGYAAVLRNIAAAMETEAASGQLPQIYAAATPARQEVQAGQADPGVAAVADQVKALASSVSDIGTIVKDLSAKSFQAAASPDRKTISPEVQSLLAKAGLTESAEKGTLTVESVDKALEAAGVKGTAAIAAKLKMREQGVLK